MKTYSVKDLTGKEMQELEKSGAKVSIGSPSIISIEEDKLPDPIKKKATEIKEMNE